MYSKIGLSDIDHHCLKKQLDFLPDNIVLESFNLKKNCRKQKIDFKIKILVHI